MYAAQLSDLAIVNEKMPGTLTDSESPECKLQQRKIFHSDGTGSFCFSCTHHGSLVSPNMQLLLEERRFTEEEVVQILDELKTVLDYLHGLSPPVVHRDIKPANVIRCDDGRLVLVGLAGTVLVSKDGGESFQLHAQADRAAIAKVLELGDYRQYDNGVWRAHKLTMENVQTNKKTDLIYEDYAFNVGISEKDFVKGRLSRLR